MNTKQKAQALADWYQKLANNDNGFLYYEEPGHACDFKGPCLTNDGLDGYIINPPKEINWLKVPVDTKVLIKHSEIGCYELRYFCTYLKSANSKFVTFNDGEAKSKAIAVTAWKFCKIHPDVEIKKDWLK